MLFLGKLKQFFFLIIAGVLLPSHASGVTGLSCLGATVAEYLIPGLGYGILGHYDKMLVLGGARWLSLNKYVSYMSDEDF